MEYEKIKELMNDMGNSKLTSIDIDFPDGMKIRMKKEAGETVVIQDTKEKSEVKPEALDEENIVKAPMVGTFYIKPSPDAKPYVEVGSKVKKGEVLCIIEAMKLMNEVESEFDGEIKEILVKDGESVEYGKPLFRIG